MLPNKDQNQLTQYYEDEILRRANQPKESGHSGMGFWWYGYPVYTNTINNYAGLSTATNTDNQPAADTTAGNVVADAGFGGMQ
jgi:hypothetical protein